MEGFVYCGIPQVVERRYVLFAFEARDELYPYDGMAGRSMFLHLSPVILRPAIHTILQNPEPAASENLVLASLEHAEKTQADGVRQNIPAIIKPNRRHAGGRHHSPPLQQHRPIIHSCTFSWPPAAKSTAAAEGLPKDAPSCKSAARPA